LAFDSTSFSRACRCSRIKPRRGWPRLRFPVIVNTVDKRQKKHPIAAGITVSHACRYHGRRGRRGIVQSTARKRLTHNARCSCLNAAVLRRFANRDMCRALRTENVSNKIRAINESCSAVRLARSFARSQVRTRGSIWSWCRCRGNVSTHVRARERERERERRANGRRRRFGIYADRCPSVNRPIRRGPMYGSQDKADHYFSGARRSIDALYFAYFITRYYPGPLPPPRVPSARPGPRGRGFTS